MTYQQFLTIKANFDNGQIPIQNANLDAFLYGNKWYPLRCFVAQIDNNITNHRAIKELVLLIPYLRIKENIPFHNANNLPIPLAQDEIKEEMQLAMQRMNDLVYS